MMTEHDFLRNAMGQELLASGDATLSTDLQVTESVLGMLECANLQEVADEESTSTTDELSSADSTDPPLNLPPPDVASLPIPFAVENPQERQSTQRVRAILPLKDYSRLRDAKIPFASKLKPSRADKRLTSLQRSRSNCCVGGRLTSTIRLADISRVLSCIVCKAVPMTSLTVHSCVLGHQVCGHCFGIGHRTCEDCQKPFDGRNEVLEKVLQRLRQECPELFPHQGPTRLNSELQFKLDLAEKEEAEKGGNCSSLEKSRLVQHSSHRPLDCPHLCCRRVIASNGFLAHFLFEHPYVPVFEMSPNCTHKFCLHPRCFEDQYPRAVAIIEVNIAAEKCEAVRKTSYLTDPDKKATFPVRRDAVVCVLLTAATRFDNSEFLVSWCACLYDEEPPLTYYLRARSASGSHTCYKGPTRSLHHSQNPRRILEGAQCLVLSPGVFGHKDKVNTQSKESIAFSIVFNLIS